MQKTLSYVNLPAIRRNAQRIRAILGEREFFAVVKADGYGHGAEEVARYIEDVVDAFCVAIVDEGISLRVAGITKPVLVLSPPLDATDVKRAKFYSLMLTVNSAQTAKLCKGVRCHVKINTGMNRYGVSLNQLDGVLKNMDAGQIDGVYSHLYAPADDGACHKQLKLFNIAEEAVRAVQPHALCHISASGGLLRGGEYLKDGVRCGILLYGYAPQGFEHGKFEPALKVYARKVQTFNFMGGGIGYNRADRKYSTLTAFRLGYADGFNRGVPLGEKTLCMDAFIASGVYKDICVFADADEYARRAGTISYEVLTSVTRRSERIYIR